MDASQTIENRKTKHEMTGSHNGGSSGDGNIHIHLLLLVADWMDGWRSAKSSFPKDHRQPEGFGNDTAAHAINVKNGLRWLLLRIVQSVHVCVRRAYHPASHCEFHVNVSVVRIAVVVVGEIQFPDIIEIWTNTLARHSRVSRWQIHNFSLFNNKINSDMESERRDMGTEREKFRRKKIEKTKLCRCWQLFFHRIDSHVQLFMIPLLSLCVTTVGL